MSGAGGPEEDLGRCKANGHISVQLQRRAGTNLARCKSPPGGVLEGKLDGVGAFFVCALATPGIGAEAAGFGICGVLMLQQHAQESAGTQKLAE